MMRCLEPDSCWPQVGDQPHSAKACTLHSGCDRVGRGPSSWALYTGGQRPLEMATRAACCTLHLLKHVRPNPRRADRQGRLHRGVRTAWMRTLSRFFRFSAALSSIVSQRGDSERQGPVLEPAATITQGG